MRSPLPHELASARELAELAILDIALRVFCDVLVLEHPMILEPFHGDPRSLRAARQVLRSARALRRQLRAYRESVVLDDSEDEVAPF